jgi:hypothetical protein
MASDDFGSEFPRDHAQAIGVFTLRYNSLELGLYGYFRRYAPGDAATQALLFSMLHNSARAEFILAMAQAREKEPEAAAIAHVIKCFNICCENRNLLLHATPMWWENDGEALTLAKLRRQEPHRMTIYDFSLEAIREAADSVDLTDCYSSAVQKGIVAREAWNALNPAPPPELPPQPPLPRKLDLSRRPEGRAGEPPPRESEQG